MIERDLVKNITKQEENHIRQVFTPYEIAQDYIELEDAYKKRFPSYVENPVKFIERYNDKQEAKKRAEDLFNAAKTKNDKALFEDQLKDIQKELVSIIPPSENIKNLFPNASSQDIKSAQKIAECEKENRGLIKNLTDDNVKKTTINNVVNELTKPENVIEYLKSNRDERKDLLEQLVHKTRVSKMGLEIEKLHEDVYKVGKVKVHCITMLDKLHLVAKSQYNVRIYVENNNILSSIIESFDLEHFKVLVVFYDRKSFNNFMESFK